MPNVFVVPPEEDQSPTWCFFDAAHPALSQIFDRPETPDIHVFSCSPFGAELPVSMGSCIAPRNSADTRSIVEALEDGNEFYHDVDTDSEYEHDTELEGALSSIHNEPSRATRDTANDSDVIEVVKVRRNREDDDEPQSIPLTFELKRSKTLKARASKVFRSLKGSLRTSKPRAQDVSTSVKSNSDHHSDIVTTTMSNTFPRPPTPSVSRRGSRILSQLFISPSLKSRSSVSSFDEPIQPDPVFSPAPSSPTQGSFVSASSTTDQLSCRSSIYEPLPDEARLKSGSLIPTATTDLKTRNRRFSILSLHKLFSFSSPAPSSPISLSFDDSSCTTPTLRSTSCTPSSVCTTSGPETPIYTDDGPLSREKEPFGSVLGSNEVLNLGLGLSMDNFSDRCSSEDYTPRAQRTFRFSTSSESGTSASERREKATPYPPPASGPSVFQEEPGDLSFEMRLESLHFDSLSFDADRFFTTN
jgi:hypothetical protein